MAAVSPARANALLLGVMVFAQLLLLSASVRSGIASNAVAGAAGTASQPAVAAERSLSAIAMSTVSDTYSMNSRSSPEPTATP